MRAVDGAARSEAIEVGGRRLAWTAVGEGPALLLVNGYALSLQRIDWPKSLPTIRNSTP